MSIRRFAAGRSLVFCGLFAAAVLCTQTKPAAAAASGGCPSGATIERDAVARVNAARSEARFCGFRRYAPAEPLRWNDKLRRAAERHARDMSRHGNFSHRGRDGTDHGDRMTRAGYAWRNAGENIAWGQRSVAAVIDRWLDSPEHCANLMSSKFVDFAVACSANTPRNGRARLYWDMVLGRPW